MREIGETSSFAICTRGTVTRAVPSSTVTDCGLNSEISGPLRTRRSVVFQRDVAYSGRIEALGSTMLGTRKLRSVRS